MKENFMTELKNTEVKEDIKNFGYDVDQSA